MEDSADNPTDDILIETNENSADPSQKAIKKRVAQTPPENEAKKQKLEGDSSLVDLSDDSPERNDAATSPKTPKTPNTPRFSKEEREKIKKERLEEKEKRRIERERALEEKRIEKEKLAEEKKIEREKKEKERLEKKQEEDRKKEEKRKEAEDKKKKEEEEKLKKEEERMKKEEEKNKKRKEEEEKKEAKRKEEEDKKEAKRKEEEAIEEKKRRESAHFVKFFKKVEKKKVPEPQNETSSWYRPFEPKDGMTLAPVNMRAPLPADFDIWAQNEEITSIAAFINSAKKVTLQADRPKIKAKLFQFHENNRPPYYGSWRKKSSKVTGPRPLEEDEGIDYEVDSDDEWEDEPLDAEECNSDDDAENDDEEGDDEDNEFFVAPCYLSEGEGEDDTNSDGEDGQPKEKKLKRVQIDSDDENSNNEADRKARLANRAEAWNNGVEKKKVTVVKPRAVGPIFNSGPDQPVEFAFMLGVKLY